MIEPYGLTLAKKISLESTYKTSYGMHIKMGAVIICGNKVLSTAVNSNKTHPIMDFYNRVMPWTKIAYLHAEMSALIKAHLLIRNSKCLNKATVYVARKLNKDGYGYARPCDACRQALKDAGIHKVVYTTDDGFAEEYI